MIQDKGKMSQLLTKNELDNNKMFASTFRTGWPNRLEPQWYLKCQRTLGEAWDVDEQGAVNGLYRLRQSFQSFNHSRVWNADKYGLFYNMPPDRNISTRN